jgi:hypothetical protein
VGALEPADGLSLMAPLVGAEFGVDNLADDDRARAAAEHAELRRWVEQMRRRDV